MGTAVAAGARVAACPCAGTAVGWAAGAVVGAGAAGALVAVGSGASVAAPPQAASRASANMAAIGSNSRRLRILAMAVMYPL